MANSGEELSIVVVRQNLRIASEWRKVLFTKALRKK